MSGSILALSQMPFQRSWAEELQQIELEREVAGTSRIEEAEFTDKELDAALRETPEQLETRSRRQVATHEGDLKDSMRQLQGFDKPRYLATTSKLRKKAQEITKGTKVGVMAGRIAKQAGGGGR